MGKDYKKGIAEVGVGMKEEDTKVPEYETSEEENRAMIRANEEDFIQGLIDASRFSEDETQRIEIIRNKKLYFAFQIRPLSSDDFERCRKRFTKYAKNRQNGIRIPESVDRVRYHSALIYEATVDEDKEKLWDNRRVWDALNAEKDQIINGLDVIECTLKAGEKDRIVEAIETLSGYDDELEETTKN